MSQKYVIAHFFEPQPEGYNFASAAWPPHVTILSNFATDWQVEKIIRTIETLAKQTAPFEIQTAGEAWFGPKQNVHVRLVEPSEPIIALHLQLLAIAEDNSFRLDAPHYLGEGYRPHISLHGTTNFPAGWRHHVANLTLVDMFPKGDISRREIIKSFSF
ncbi:MAG TPA: 2'-5' RNA ligase family protein [Verrucomicrobiae bacterium]|nr:2'-5' RNA ligase family protein [Verrucomicrobiae bacterium]